MEIQNPLGSWGTNPQPLGNLTEGIEALQKAEIEKQIGEIATTKKQIRDDELWMLTQTPEIIDAMRANMGAKISEQAKQFTQDWAEISKKTKGHPIPLEEKIKIVNGMRKVNESVADEQSFIKGTQALFAQIPTRRAQLKYDSQKKDFDMRVADFVKKINDPTQKPTLLDASEMFRVEDRPAEIMFGEIDKQLIPLVDAGIKTAAAGQWTPIDEENVKRSVKAMVDGYGNDLITAGQERGVFATKEQAADYFYNRVVESIDKKFRSAPSAGGPGKRKEVSAFYSPTLRSLIGDYDLSDGQEGVRLDWTQAPIKNVAVTPRNKWSVSVGDFTPAQVMLNGMVQGSVKSTRKEPLFFDAKEFTQEMEDQLPKGGVITPVKGEDGESLIKVTWSEPIDEITEVPYEELRGLIKDVAPVAEQFYTDRVMGEAGASFRRSKVMQTPTYKYGDKKAKAKAIGIMEREMKQEKAGTKTKSDPLGLFK